MGFKMGLLRGIVASVAIVVFVTTSSAAVVTPPFLVASDYMGGMKRVNPATGVVIGTISDGFGAGELQLGPDGTVYASYAESSKIVKINPFTGLSTGSIALPGKPRDITLGPDGQLYVALVGDGNGHGNIGIYRLDPVTEQLSPRFNTSVLNGAPIGIAFGPGGDLFTCLDGRFAGNGSHSVVRINGQTGDVVGVVTTTNINIPQSIAFGPNGDFFVANQGSSIITRYDGNGSFLGTLATNAGNAQGLYFLSDKDLVWGRGGNDFVRYNFDSNSLTTFSSGYSFAMGIVLVPEPGSFPLLASAPTVMLLRRRRGR